MGEVRTLPLQRGRHITQMDGICSVTANFSEPPRPEVRGTPLPRTRVNKPRMDGAQIALTWHNIMA